MLGKVVDVLHVLESNLSILDWMWRAEVTWTDQSSTPTSTTGPTGVGTSARRGPPQTTE